MDNIWLWLFYALPWWLQVAVLAILIGIGFAFAVAIFGYERVKGWIVPALVAIAALGALGKAKQQGYNDRRDVQKAEQDKQLDKFKQVQQQVDEKPISQVDKENEKWLRD